MATLAAGQNRARQPRPASKPDAISVSDNIIVTILSKPEALMRFQLL
jgi:hypothetical protein